ncbi:MAG TPA: PLP-dependent aminotransferase family protein [Candidatus Dormibacteraeota bacterium]|nr:PLP-dependent aminotransferase family protein [Candidatus Dormibacteraeota bacterium]
MPTPLGSAWSPTFAQRTEGASGELAAILALSAGTDLISFAGGLPDPETFPVPILLQITRTLLEGDPGTALQYSPTPGLPGLREALADRLQSTEGSRPEPAELMVTSGNIDAVGLLAKATVDGGDVVAVESPTYLGALDAFRGFQADIRGIPVDDDGIDVEAFDHLCAATRVKLLYTIPDHQNPTGMTMSAERRHALVEVCRRHGVLVVEDVAYRELTFTAESPPTLWSLAPDVVTQVGTTSKTFFPGVRLGWAVGPPPVVAQMVIAKQSSDQCAGAFGQRLLEEYLRGGHMDPQLRRSNALYSNRCNLMQAALDEYMPEGLTWTRPHGGFFIWLTGPEWLDTSELSAQAREAGVAFVPGRPFHPAHDGSNRLRLAFSLAGDDDIDEGIRRLGTLFSATLERR